jgi:hypothetical protein
LYQLSLTAQIRQMLTVVGDADGLTGGPAATHRSIPELDA